MGQKKLRFPLWDKIPLIRKKPEDEILEILATLPVFDNIPYRNLRTIYIHSHIRTYKEGEHVFRKGEPGVGMYIILNGRVEVYNPEKHLIRQYAILERGDFFGELALLEDLPRTASVRTLVFTQLMGFFRPDLFSMLSRKPRLASRILFNTARSIGHRLVRTNEELEKLAWEIRDAQEIKNSY